MKDRKLVYNIEKTLNLNPDSISRLSKIYIYKYSKLTGIIHTDRLREILQTRKIDFSVVVELNKILALCIDEKADILNIN